MVKVIHKPSGQIEEVNPTVASRLIEYSQKNGRGWEYVEEKKAPAKELKPNKAKESKSKKNEDTNEGSNSSNP